MQETIENFNKAAPEYWSRSQSGIWGWIKRKEQSALFAALEPHPGDLVFDLGCGAGVHSYNLVETYGCRVFGVDPSPQMINEFRYHTRQPAQLGTLKNCSLPEPAKKVLCAGVLEFEPNPTSALKNVASQMSEKGLLVCLVPRTSLAGKCYQIWHHFHGCKVWIRTDTDYKDIARSAGLRWIRSHVAGPMAQVIILEMP